MELTIKLNLKDYTDFNYSFFIRKLRDILRMLKVFVLVLVVLFTAVILTMFLFRTSNHSVNISAGSHKSSIIPILLLVTFSFVVVTLIMLFINITIASRLNFQSNKIAQAENHFVFSDEMFEVTSDSLNVRIAWDKVNSVGFYKNCYGVFISTAQAHILPKRCFSGVTEMKAFEEFISRVLDADKIKK